jgi:2'-5' RNA ligase
MYSIWLMPSNKVSSYYSQIIQGLSEQFDTPYFEPHITLFSGIKTELDSVHFYNISVLAALTNTFDISLYKLCFKADYFRAFYLVANEHEMLNNLNKELQVIFPTVENVAFSPHLSLLYGEVDVAEKEALALSFGNHLFGKFEAKTIRIMRTEGEVELWEVVEEFPLHDPNDQTMDFITPLFARNGY